MTGVGHFSTGLLIKARFPAAPLWMLVFAAWFTDLIWFTLHIVKRGVLPALEYSTVKLPFEYIGDMSFILQPYSHSLTGSLIQAVFLALLFWVMTGNRRIVLPVFLAVLGHWCVDFLVHDADLTILPLVDAARIGPPISLDASQPDRGLYALFPIAGFLFQTAVASLCVFIFLRKYPIKEPKKLYIFIAVFALLNLAALPSFWKGAMTASVTGMIDLVLGVVVDAVVAGGGLLLVLRYSNPAACEARPDERANLSGIQRAAVWVCALLALLYALQGILPDSPLSMGVWTFLFALLFAGAAILMQGPRVVWGNRLAILTPVIGGTLIRIAVAPGQLGILNMGLETLLIILAALARRRGQA